MAKKKLVVEDCILRDKDELLDYIWASCTTAVDKLDAMGHPDVEKVLLDLANQFACVAAEYYKMVSLGLIPESKQFKINLENTTAEQQREVVLGQIKTIKEAHGLAKKEEK